MNKIYNNLNVENLTKTDWFNQFNEKQKEQINFGLDSNLDVSIYAKTEFDYEQMVQIRLGLKDNLDISIYAKSDFHWRKMKQIRENLLKEKKEKENEQNTQQLKHRKLNKNRLV